jgi:predicted nucleotidyltransferase
MDKDLHELVEKLKHAAGSNLKSVVLYGSAASGEFHAKHSDLNVLCVLARLDGAEIEKLNPAAEWWSRKGHPAPLLFTQEELHDAADVFAIEMLDIQASHRVLHGEDVFAGLHVPMSLHRLQVEHDLRTNLIRLRQGYLLAPRELKSLLGLMTTSVSTFGALFRHALIALGQPAAKSKREAVDRLAKHLGFDASGIHTILDVREGKLTENQVDVQATFHSYLVAVTRVAEEVDRRLAVGNT